MSFSANLLQFIGGVLVIVGSIALLIAATALLGPSRDFDALYLSIAAIISGVFLFVFAEAAGAIIRLADKYAPRFEKESKELV